VWLGVIAKSRVLREKFTASCREPIDAIVRRKRAVEPGLQTCGYCSLSSCAAQKLRVYCGAPDAICRRWS